MGQPFQQIVHFIKTSKFDKMETCCHFIICNQHDAETITGIQYKKQEKHV